jgi:hypothetical protein
LRDRPAGWLRVVRWLMAGVRRRLVELRWLGRVRAGPVELTLGRVALLMVGVVGRR